MKDFDIPGGLIRNSCALDMRKQSVVRLWSKVGLRLLKVLILWLN